MNYLLYLNAKRIKDYSKLLQNYFEKGITIKYSNKNLFIKNFNKYDNINELKYEIAEKLMNNCDLKHLKYNNFFFFFTSNILGRKYINYQEEFNLIKNGVLQMYLTEEYEKIKNKELNVDYSTHAILKEAIDYGEQIKTEIIFDKKNNKEKIVNESELIENNYLSDNLEKLGSTYAQKEEQYSVLSLLSKILQEQGIETAVYKESNTDNNDSIVQMMCCDYSNKYDFVFDFGEEKNKKILQAEAEYVNLCANLKKTLSEKLKIDEKDIILSIPKKGSAKISVTFATPGIYKEKDLENAIKDDKELNKIKKIHKSLIMEGCKLTTKLLSQEGNNKDPYWGKNERRGGYDYIPPEGWIGYGLNVKKKYDGGNDEWLSYQNNLKNQYAIAYYPIRSRHEDSKEMKKLIANLSNLNIMNDDKDSYHNIFANEIDINSPNGEKCGNGIYLYQDIKIAEHNASLIEVKGVLYKVILMCRVHPKKIRIPQNYPFVWILNSNTFEIRQYRILIKIVILTPLVDNTFITYPQPHKIFRHIISKKDTSYFESKNVQKIMGINNCNKYEAIIYIYSTNDYIIFNNSLIKGEIQKNSKYNKNEIISYIWCLHSVLRNYDPNMTLNKIQPVKDGTIVYRKADITFDFAKYEKGSEFYLSNFVSTSLNKNSDFGGKHRMHITIKNNEKSNYCYYIKDISAFKSEEEVLITAYTSFYITNVEGNKKDGIIVHAECRGYILDDNNVDKWPAENNYEGNTPNKEGEKLCYLV